MHNFWLLLSKLYFWKWYLSIECARGSVPIVLRFILILSHFLSLLFPVSKVGRLLLKHLMYNIFFTRYQVLVYFGQIKPRLKLCKVSRWCAYDCCFFMILNIFFEFELFLISENGSNWWSSQSTGVKAAVICVPSFVLLTIIEVLKC